MAQPATVLILADVGDPERLAVEAACTAAGYTPVIEPSAEAATGKLTAKRFDALVVHLGTPGAALACMRARGKLLRTRIPVIALVDGDDEPAFSRAYRAGADEVLLLEKPEWLTARLKALPRSTIPQPGNARGDAVVADADRTRAEVIERVLKDAGFRVEVAADGFSTRLQVGRPSLKVAVVDASLDDVQNLIAQARTKGARCAWIVRARPEQLKELQEKLAKMERVAVVSAYGPPEDVLFETNRLLEPRATDGRNEVRLLHGGILRLVWTGTGGVDIGYSYNISASGIFVRTLLAPAAKELAVEIFPPDGDEKIRLECEVVWRREFGLTRKEPVPAGFALKIVGGQLGAWSRVCSLRASLMPRAEAPARPSAGPRRDGPAVAAPVAPAAVSVPPEELVTLPPAAPSAAPAAPSAAPAASASVPPRVAPPADVDIRPREHETSVEEMLASVLSETVPDDEAAGAAPLSIDGGSVVELHAAAEAPAAKTEPEEPVTAVHTSPYASERAINELLSEASDATKTPIAVPRTVDRLARDAKAAPGSGRGGSLPPRPAPRVDPKSVELAVPVTPRSDKIPESRPVPARAKADSAPGSGRSADSAKPASVPPPKPPSVPPPKPETRVDATSTGEPTTLDVTDITPASLGFDLSEDGRIIEAVRQVPPVVERRPEPGRAFDGTLIGKGGTRPGSGPPMRPVEPPPKPEATAAIPAVAVKPSDPTTRVVADPDALETGDTMRPETAGILERPSPVPHIAPARVPSFGAPPRDPPKPAVEMPLEEDFAPPPRRRSPAVWAAAIAVVLGGLAAFVVAPSLRGMLGTTTAAPAAPAPTSTPLPAATGANPEPVQEVKEPGAEAVQGAPAAQASAPAVQGAPAAKASAEAEPAAPKSPAAPSASAAPESATLDDAALSALEPGKGYLYVASPLATNVYIYGNLAGTTNQKIATKCGPRFIRLGTERGAWQGEGQVQIVKCGALTRVEMGQ